MIYLCNCKPVCKYYSALVLNKPQTYSLSDCFRRSCCLMTLMIIFSGTHLAQPLGGKGKYAQYQFGVWANCSMFTVPLTQV